ncbi:MAG: hypothetical protein ACREDR_05025 [Blastocatellia bacterium]
MKNRSKWMLVGLGFNFGLQVLISLAFTAFAYSAASSSTYVPQGSAILIILGFTIAAYFVGGFVVGWMDEKLRVGDAVLAAILTLLLTVLIYAALPSASKGQFVSALWLRDPIGHFALTLQGLIFVASSLVVASVGAYVGWHMTVPSEGLFDRVALLLGLVGAVVGPFVLLTVGGRDPNNPTQPGLPWYFLAIVLVLVLIVVAVGFMMFARQSREAKEISINPERKE